MTNFTYWGTRDRILIDMTDIFREKNPGGKKKKKEIKKHILIWIGY